MSSRADILIVIPVLRRPHRAAPVLESIREATTLPHRVLFVGSPGDDDEHQAVRDAGGDLLVIDRLPGRGDWARKIQAAYDTSDEPLIFLGADDLRFHPGWLEAALRALTPGIGVVGTNDLGNRRVIAGDHATHCVVTRDYVERFGTIDQPGQVLHTGYWHEYVDDELVGTAKMRGAWAFAADAVVEHLHPNWNKADSDGLYDQQRARMRDGLRIYQRRRHLWTSP